MMKICGTCVNSAWLDGKTPVTAVCFDCKFTTTGEPSNWKPKPKTKGDRVRSMNDEELAELLFRAAHSTHKPLSKQEVLEGLRAPAKEAK